MVDNVAVTVVFTLVAICDVGDVRVGDVVPFRDGMEVFCIDLF